ncbi:M24 family metallopeptidase [Microbacterium kribbense]|uniref:M24 family metallopeptidase n=2 Tax=Microbacterium kribbense TaxID=433645 RepID=A0ABP7GIC1_9MICO
MDPLRTPSPGPSLTLHERDRRWAMTRRFLDEHNLDGLIVAGLKSRERFELYLANDLMDGVVVFPRVGAPVHLTWVPTKITGRTDAVGRERTYWIDDVRAVRLDQGIVDTLAEMRIGRGRIGVLGLASNIPGEPHGVIPYPLWEAVSHGAPHAEFVDVWWDYAMAMLPKSAEELSLVRESAHIGEHACEAMQAAIFAGARETEVYAAVMGVLYANGAVTSAPNLLMRAGTEHFTISQPAWTYDPGAARTLKTGDLVNAEIFSIYGGLETQQQMTVSIGAPDRLHTALASATRDAYHAGIAAIKPGATFADIDQAMQKVVLDAGFWHIAPQVQSLNPIVLNGALCHGLDRLPDRERFRGLAPVPRTGDGVIVEGMVFALEPNACDGPHRVTVGGSVIVTADGVEELNHLATNLTSVSG